MITYFGCHDPLAAPTLRPLGARLEQGRASSRTRECSQASCVFARANSMPARASGSRRLLVLARSARSARPVRSTEGQGTRSTAPLSSQIRVVVGGEGQDRDARRPWRPGCAARRVLAERSCEQQVAADTAASKSRGPKGKAPRNSTRSARAPSRAAQRSQAILTLAVADDVRGAAGAGHCAAASASGLDAAIDAPCRRSAGRSRRARGAARDPRALPSCAPAPRAESTCSAEKAASRKYLTCDRPRP